MIESRSLRILLPVLAVALAAGWLAVPRADGATPAIRGRRLAEELGCFACHGPEGRGGVADPVAPGGEIPDWSYATAKLFVASVEDVREWILHGSTAAERARGAGRHRSLAPMPGYAEHLSARDADDLVAYFLAVSGWRPAYGEDEYLGRQVAQRLGCFGCHGPSGMGGVRDPSSRSGFIPPLAGGELGTASLRQWILHGRHGRRVPMPGYHDHVSDADLARLIAYLESLRAAPQAPAQRGGAKEVIGAVPVPGGAQPVG